MKNRRKRDWFGLIEMFIGAMIFISLIIIILRYGIDTAFFIFKNFDGTWERIINIGMFWVIGDYCIREFFRGLDKVRGKE